MEAVSGAHVMVVDDDAMIRFIVRAVLEKAGMRVSDAEDGERALARLGAADSFSLLVLDLDMPGLSGLQVLEKVRLARASTELPVIILTGSDSAEDERRVLAAGADAYVRKPIAPDRLLNTVRTVLSGVPG